MSSDFIQRIKDLPKERLVLLAAQLQERLEQERAEQSDARFRAHEPIAIVGVGCRFPGGVHDPESYWELLVAGRDVISEVPADRWDPDDYYDPDWRTEGKMATKWGGFLDEIDMFDARLFGISPREVASLDPQHRLLLEVTWQALERAGIAPGSLSGTRTGVYVGLSSIDYFQSQMRRGAGGIDGYMASGSAPSVAAGRIAYTLGLNGPALSIDTACSSSLVAVHLAVQALRSRQCDVAIGAGVNAILSPTTTIALSKSQMMAADGRCKTFSAAADGFVRGEGCGVIVLKRLSDAQRAGDRVVGVIRGTAVNQDGRSNGLTAPNGPAQEAVLAAALEDAGAAPADVGYIEAHGTGTKLGDPIEVQALGAVFGRNRPPGSRLQIGSVKTNFGHLESAAGIAGLMKAMLILEHGSIPPHCHFAEPSPVIPWDRLPIDVPVVNTPWPAEQPLLAGVSSFGFSGTNAHVILAGPTDVVAPLTQRETPGRSAHVCALSAQSAVALDELAALHGAHLATHAESLEAVCRVAATGRDTFAHREAFVASSIDELRDDLLARSRGQLPKRSARAHVESTRAVRPVWLFTGQGAQYAGMGRDLFTTEPVFTDVLETCDTFLRDRFDLPLLDVMFGGDDERIHQTGFTQPALFSLQVALAALWRSWGVRPGAVIGHSVGEYAAAHVACLFDLEDGLTMIATRGRLMQALPSGGRMVALFASPEQIEPALGSRRELVSVAAVNGPSSTVISGGGEHVQAVLDALGGRFEVRDLEVSHAFHSPLMDPVLGDFARVAATVSFHEPTVPIMSNVFGETAGLDRLGTADYWTRHIREPVRFGPSMAALVEQGHQIFLEIGPGPTLSAMAARTFDDPQLRWVHSLRRDRADAREIASAVGALWTGGVDVDWTGWLGAPAASEASQPRPILPTYPMQRERFWADGLGPWRSDESAAPVSASAAAEADDVDGLLYEVVWPRRAHPRERASTPGAFLARPQESASLLDRVAPQIAIANGTATYDEFIPALDALCGRYVLGGLRSLGFAEIVGERHTFAPLAAQLGVLPTHHRLLRRMLEMLTEDGVLAADGDGWTVLAQTSTRPTATPAELIGRFPAFSAEVDLVERCGDNVAGILHGDVDPLEVLFPGGSTAQMDGIYRNLPLARAFNELIATAVAAAVRATPTGRPIRILEVGAGSGSTTDAVLAAIGDLEPAVGIDYLFTDISASFTVKARARFAGVQAVRFGQLDASRDPADQGFAAASFDMIIAANVIHATPDLRTTLGNLRGLLADGGQLVMLEATTRERFSDLTVGFTPGWWSFEDVDLRPDYALLDVDHWRAVLTSVGFDSAVAAPDAEVEPSLRREAVIVASTPVSTPTPADVTPEQHSQSWVIVGDDALAGAVSAALTASGDSAVRVASGNRVAVARSIAAGAAAGVVLVVATETGGVDSREPDAGEPDSRAAHERRITDALGTVHGLLDAQPARPLWIVTQSAQSVVPPGDVHDAGGATVWGLSHVIDLEHPELRCRRIDVGDEGIAESAVRIVEELQHPDPDETQVAFRAGVRSVRRVGPASIEPSGEVSFAADGSYIVSGGLRGIGLLVGGWLVEHGVRRLVVFGRHAPDDSALAAIERWRGQGATVVVEIADASVDLDVGRVVDSASSLGPLRGIVHNAGALDDAALLRQDWSRFATVFGAKVFGTEALLRHVDPAALDFLLLFASGAGVAGSAGQANHAAANAYLDAVAAQLRGRGVPAASIDWGPWTQIGAAVDRGVDKVPGAFSPERGLAALGRIIGATIRRAGPAQVLVRSADWSDLLDRYPAGAEPPLYRDLLAGVRGIGLGTTDGDVVDAPSATALLDELRALPERRRRTRLRDEVRILAGRVLDIDDVGQIELGVPLHDLGLDSLMAVDLRNRLGTALRCELPATLLFEHPSINEVVDHLLAEQVVVDDAASSPAPASQPEPQPEPLPPQDPPADAAPTGGAAADDIAERLAARLDRLGRGGRR